MPEYKSLFEFQADLSLERQEYFEKELKVFCEGNKIIWTDRTEDKEEVAYHSDAPFFEAGIKFRALARAMMNRNTTVEELVERANDAGMNILIGVESKEKKQ